LFAAFAAGQNRSIAAGKVAIVGDHPFRLHIQTSGPVTPQVQLVPNPDRLVIDLPNAIAGPGFHGLSVRNGEIRGIRTSTFSTAPLVTRVVVDLKAPQWYQVAPDSTGLVITLGDDASSDNESENKQTTIGWVSNARPSHPTRTAFAVKTPKLPNPQPASVNGASVQFANGLLSIHANNASLSEVLFQIQKKTGAEIAIPSGTEQERVAGDFGPGKANEVLAELLNGSQLNFVVVENQTNHTLRSVILSPKGSETDAPGRFAQTYSPPPQAYGSQPEAQNVAPENPEPAVTPVPLPQQAQVPGNGPPPEPPQD
jgi:hypothetical protein